MNKRWELKKTDSEKAKQLQRELNVRPLVCGLLVQRGIETYSEAKQFFRPSFEYLHDPFLMRGMNAAIDRIHEAIQRNEKLMVFGDYDVDGTTSVALAFSYFEQYFAQIEYYIPDRYEEGYGISYKSIDYASENNVDLIIALDCGIRSVDEILYAKEKGIDYIICDHHLPGDEVPQATAVLDPKQPGCNYPYGELSGCGIGFKLIQAFNQKKGRSVETLQSYLDLVAISIASDIVPITGENRTLMQLGLKVLNEQPRKGLDALYGFSQIKTVDEETGEITYKTIEAGNIVFNIGPRINAAGRLGDAKDAVKMLLAGDMESAEQYAKVLHERNTERQNMDKQTLEEALAILNNDPKTPFRKTNVLFREDWHKGVIGIVASKVIENIYRPTIMLTASGGKATGSARSVPGYNVIDAIDACKDLLEQFGGHKYAAGLTMPIENIDAFRDKFDAVVAATIDDDLLIPQVQVDAELSFDVLSQNLYAILKQFEPFGPGNMRPVFRANDVVDAGNSRIVGDNHLKLALKQNGTPTFNGIAFNQGDFLSDVKESSFDICYSLTENNWRGNTTLEIRPKDFDFH